MGGKLIKSQEYEITEKVPLLADGSASATVMQSSTEETDRI